MPTDDSLKTPIHSFYEWKAALFPSVTEEEMNTDETPSDIAVKWATKSVESLPNKHIKPTQ